MKLFNLKHIGFVLVSIALLLSSCGQEEKKAKYIFYVIGDGMGANQVELAKMYRSEIKGEINSEHLSFSNFPNLCLATTFSTSNAITCSAASGTALASGKKTSVGTIGMLQDHKTDVYSIAHFAKKAGMKVGVTTSVSIDHATPAAFYAHQPKRGNYYEIGFDAITADFDLYGGSGFLKPTKADDKDAPELLSALKNAGYTFVRGFSEYPDKSDSSKIIITQKEGKTVSALPYAIDRKSDDLTLSQIVEASINFLFKKSDKKGFFLMIEGGKIDWACHSNDPGTTLREVEDFSVAMEKVLAFYEQHKDETLIVITADHETGGLVLARKGYILNLKALDHQKISKEELSKSFSELSVLKNNKVSWLDVKNLLTEKLGFWVGVNISSKQEESLQKCYNEVFVKKTNNTQETLYASSGQMTTLAIDILNEIALINWGTFSHSATPVPVYAIGVGAENFRGVIDNTDIPKIISKASNIVME